MFTHTHKRVQNKKINGEDEERKNSKNKSIGEKSCGECRN